MGVDYKHQNETFQKDFDEIFKKGVWDKDQICMMKDYKKLIYYNKVLEAMEEGYDYPGSEYMPDSRSYARGRDAMTGRYISRDMRYPHDDTYWGNTSGRRYYDSEKEKAIHKLHHMMENTDNAEQKSALKLAIAELEEK